MPAETLEQEMFGWFRSPLAAAVGAGLPITEPRGNMIVDVGGGTTEAAVISLGGLVSWKSVPVAGDAFTERIIEFVKSEYNLFIGERTAEMIKINIGFGFPLEKMQMEVTGRDLLTGLPKRITISSDAVRDAFKDLLGSIVDAVKGNIGGHTTRANFGYHGNGLLPHGWWLLTKGLGSIA